MDKVDRIAIRKYLSSLHRKNRKSSIARKISTLRSFFKYLVREQKIASNPAKSVSTPKVEKTLPTALTVDETFRLMESPKHFSVKSSSNGAERRRLRDRAILELLYSSGLRGERIGGDEFGSIGPGFRDCESPRERKEGTHRAGGRKGHSGLEGLFRRSGRVQGRRTSFFKFHR